MSHNLGNVLPAINGNVIIRKNKHKIQETTTTPTTTPTPTSTELILTDECKALLKTYELAHNGNIQDMIDALSGETLEHNSLKMNLLSYLKINLSQSKIKELTQQTQIITQSIEKIPEQQFINKIDLKINKDNKDPSLMLLLNSKQHYKQNNGYLPPPMTLPNPKLLFKNHVLPSKSHSLH